MKFKEALEIAKDCGLETIGEAILNIKYHAGNLFDYGEEVSEYKELCNDFKSYCEKHIGCTFDMRLDEIIWEDL